MHMIFKTNDVELIIETLYRGADINVVNAVGETPCAYALRQTLAELGL